MAAASPLLVPGFPDARVTELMRTPEGRYQVEVLTDRILCAADLREFMRGVWPVIEPSGAQGYKHNWHIDLVAEYLTAVDDGEIQHLIVNIPPRHMKSRLITVAWPVWSWIRNPGVSWQFWSYSDDLMIEHSSDRRTIIESDWYQERWGDTVKIARGENRKGKFRNTMRGTMDASRSKTGKGGNRIVVDDPVDPEQALSPVVRETANRFFDLTLSTRVNNPDEDAIIVVMQRLHENDLTGHLLDRGYTHLALPAEAEREERIVFPVSGRVVERKPGDLLWPERFGPAVVEKAKVTLGPFGYASQYQQNPVPLTGAILPAEKWGRYTRQSLPTKFRRVAAFADTAFETGEENDYTAIALWGEGEIGWYLLDLVWDRLDFPDLVEAGQAAWKRWKMLPPGWRPTRFVIERKASGASLVQTFKKLTRIPAIGYVPKGDKVTRVHNISGYQGSGKLLLPATPEDSLAPEPNLKIDGVNGFIHEHRLFPKGAHDDRVDTTTMMLHYWELDPPPGVNVRGGAVVGRAKEPRPR